jgi:hypothetical protein
VLQLLLCLLQLVLRLLGCTALLPQHLDVLARQLQVPLSL